MIRKHLTLWIEKFSVWTKQLRAEHSAGETAGKFYKAQAYSFPRGSHLSFSWNHPPSPQLYILISILNSGLPLIGFSWIWCRERERFTFLGQRMYFFQSYSKPLFQFVILGNSWHYYSCPIHGRGGLENLSRDCVVLDRNATVENYNSEHYRLWGV